LWHGLPPLDSPSRKLKRQLPFSLDLAPVDFFLFRKVKEALAGNTLAAETMKTTWEGVVRTIANDNFITAFRRWPERCKKCVRIGGDYVEKS